MNYLKITAGVIAFLIALFVLVILWSDLLRDHTTILKTPETMNNTHQIPTIQQQQAAQKQARQQSIAHMAFELYKRDALSVRKCTDIDPEPYVEDCKLDAEAALISARAFYETAEEFFRDESQQ